MGGAGARFVRALWHGGGAWLLLCLIGLYRISDIVLGVMSNLFYQDLGFTKEQIATAVKTYGVIISIAGGFLGGILITRIGVMAGVVLGGGSVGTNQSAFRHVGANWGGTQYDVSGGERR